MNIYLGLDLGCTGCKAVAIDENGKVLASDEKRYDGSLIARENKAYDQDPSVLRKMGMQCRNCLSGRTLWSRRRIISGCF